MSEAIENAYVVEWWGPYTDEQLEEIEDRADSGSLYIISGLRKYQRGNPKIQYIGISERGAIVRFHDKGHPGKNVVRERRYWLAHLSNLQQEATRANLELVEHALIYTCKTEINKKKKGRVPKTPVVVINRWFTKNGNYREKRTTPVQLVVPDVILYDGRRFWTCERLKYCPSLSPDAELLQY